MRFKLLSGQHIGDTKDPVTKTFPTYNPGDIIESKHALDVMFANKFQRQEGPAPASTAKPKLAKVNTREDEEKIFDKIDDQIGGTEDGVETEEALPEVDYGEDITEKVKTAKKKGLKVFENKTEKFFSVFDEDRLEVPLATHLADQKAVLKFIASVE